ncbi:MAG: tetratricopeptide repeat protein, partial [Verrucomicrobiaceae bacterium]
MQKTPMYRSTRTAAALMAVASSMPVVVTVANAGEGGSGLSGLAQREMIRRQDAVTEGDALLNEGRAAYAKGDYQQAVDKYRQALDRLPNAPMVSDRRQSYIEHLSDASVALSMQHRKVGKYAEARTLLDNVLAADPNNGEAKRELGYLDDPIRTNPALTYEHTKNVDQVRRSLYTAEGNFNLGKYDDAKREYENVLRVDPYNSAARRGLEQVSTAKSDYYR